MSGAERFTKQKQGRFAVGSEPEVLRFSSAVRRMRERGTRPEDIAEFERDRKFAARCSIHGEIVDPVVGLVNTQEGPRAVFICPWCSSPEILKRWEEEGRKALA